VKRNNPALVQFIRYFGAALVGYAFDFGGLLFLKEVLGVHYLVAATISFTLGLVVVYILSSRYVFGESKITSRSVEFGLFAAIGVVGLILLNILMWIFTDLLSINYLVSKIIATVFVYAWNFFARRVMYHN
jgi:putative flippase GtrA